MTNSARPARKKLAASVTMMSGTPEAVITRPVIVDSPTVTARTATLTSRHVPRPWSSIHSADRQLASTIIAPTDRSTPPDTTIAPWAMARKASGIVPAVIVRISKPPKSGSCETRQSSSTMNSTATPTVQPWRCTNRDSRLVRSGSAW